MLKWSTMLVLVYPDLIHCSKEIYLPGQADPRKTAGAGCRATITEWENISCCGICSAD